MKRIAALSSFTLFFASMLYLSFPGRLMDMKAYDIYSCIRGTGSPPTEIVIVGIDEESLSVMQHPWPWPRSIHGKLIHALSKEGARGIVMDIVFSNPSVPKEDHALAEAIKAYGNVVLAADIEVVMTDRFAQSTMVTPIEEFVHAGARFGISSISLDVDNVVRRIFWGAGERLSLEVTCLEMLGLSRRTDVSCMIRFTGSGHPFPYASYYQALDPGRHLPRGFFKDKLVVVGKYSQPDLSSRYGLHLQPPSPVRGVDMFATPLYIVDSALTPGIEVHASALLSLMRGDFLKPLKSMEAMILILVLSVFLTLANRHWRPLKSIGLTLLFSVGYLLVSYRLFDQNGIFLPFSAPLAAILVNFISSGVMSYIGVERKRRYLKEAFSHYLSPQVVRKVIDEPGRLRLGGQRVRATVLFSDLAGFTQLSERLDPEALVSIMNRYMTEMTKIIFKYNGTLDKFIGDAIMAVWGTPAEDQDQALHACRAALEMLRRTKDLADEIVLPGYRLSMRAGINTGIVMAGNMGSEDRFDFTVIGDHVNVASRLEGLNKTYGTHIIVSEATRIGIEKRLTFRELDSVKVKGKEQAIHIYELVNGNKDTSMDCFEEGLCLFRECRFDAAREKFQKSLDIDPSDGPSQFFLERCNRLIQSLPGRGE